MKDNKSKDDDFDFDIEIEEDKSESTEDVKENSKENLPKQDLKQDNLQNEDLKIEIEKIDKAIDKMAAKQDNLQDVTFEIMENDTSSDVMKEEEKIKSHDSDIESEDFELGEDDDFEIIESDEEVNVQIDSDRKKRRIRLVAIAIVVLIVCSFGCYLFITQRAQLDKFDSALHENQYALAKNLYSELMDSQKSEADMIVESKVDEIYLRYYKGSINIEKAKEELDLLTAIKSGARDKIREMKRLFNVLVTSEENYAKGKECYDLGQLKNSIIYYGKVIPKDAHYKSAQNILKKISAEYRKEQIDIAEGYAKEEDYDSAIKIMYAYLKLLSKDQVAMKQLQAYKSAKLDLNISDIQDTVDVYVKKNNFVAAINIVKNAMTEYGEDERLVTQLASLKKSMYKEVNSYIESERYVTAVGILKKYIKIERDDEKATKLIEKYSNKVSSGVFLSKAKPKSEEGKSYVIDDLQDYKDANGQKYEDVLEVVGYRNLESKGNRVIENNGYTKLTGTIGYVSSKDIAYYKEGEGKIIISGDGKTLFTSEVMTEKSKNQSVDLDISSYKTITFAWEPADSKNVKMYSIVLGDFKFAK